MLRRGAHPWAVLGMVVLLALSATSLVVLRAHAAATAPTSLTGLVVVAHQDGLGTHRSGARLEPLLDTARGLVPLHLDGLSAPPGSHVRLDHVRYERGAIVQGGLAMLGPPTQGPTGPNAGPANFTPGPKRVLVILMQVSGQAAPGSADAVRNIVFTAPNSADAFIRDESFGQLSLTGKLRSDGDIYGPYVVHSVQKPDVCDNVSWGQDAEKQFNAQTGMDAESWDNVIFVFQASACNFSGEGEIGDVAGAGARHVWANPVLTGGVPTTSVIVHELGHNFGADHAGGLVCTAGGVRVSFTEGCASDAGQLGNQYLDPFDVMGSGARQESAYHKWESNWLPSSAVLSVIRNGTYLIAPEEASTPGLQLLEVPRAIGLPSYWLDFRQPFGTFFDTFAGSDPIVNGVSIRYANSSQLPHPAKSWLIDTTPDTDSFADAPLGVGRTYLDVPRGVSVTTLAVSPAGALVQIQVPHGLDTSPPAAASGLAATNTDGTVRVRWLPASDDSGVVQRYVVRRDGAPFADVYGTSAVDAMPLVGTSSYDVTPVDPSGNLGPSTSIDVATADTHPPTAPQELHATVAGGSVHLTWMPASDDVSVATYEVDRDGHAVVSNAPSTGVTDLAVPQGTHAYTVRAVDASGNVGASSAPLIVWVATAGPAPPSVASARVKAVNRLTLHRIGSHRVVVSWRVLRGARGYQVLRAGDTKATLLATVRKPRYVDGKAPAGRLRTSRYIVRAVLR